MFNRMFFSRFININFHKHLSFFKLRILLYQLPCCMKCILFFCEKTETVSESIALWIEALFLKIE